MLKNWVEKIRENNANQVAELYHDDGLLLGTFSNIERHGKELIFNYFENLFKTKINVEIISDSFELLLSILSKVILFFFISRNMFNT